MTSPSYTPRTFRKGASTRVADSIDDEVDLRWDGWAPDDGVPYTPPPAFTAAQSAALKAGQTPYPAGMELAFAEARSATNQSTTAVNVFQDMSQYGLWVVVPPMSRPCTVRGKAQLTHSVAGGLVSVKILEVSNGVDSILMSDDPKSIPAPAVGVVSVAEVRVPPGPRERTFKFGWFNMTAGTATLYTPGDDISGLNSNANWPLFIEAVAA